ncbi:hypothetical protein [Granulicoccus sp. GXG6511]|uniref:hypothetical protein n=1 Tax=Granulicoccus sp. GXG6511 TaxID=3381351 RepID=UPI003D7D81FB
MSFEDLPPNWPSMSLRNPDLAADVVDLVVSHRDRLSNSLSLLLCDHLGCMIQPVTINGMKWGCTDPERQRPFDMLGPLMDEEQFAEISGVVVAIAHRQPRVRMSDHEWARTARSRLDRLGLDLFGCFVAHSRGVLMIPDGLETRRADAS